MHGSVALKRGRMLLYGQQTAYLAIHIPKLPMHAKTSSLTDWMKKITFWGFLLCILHLITKSSIYAKELIDIGQLC